VARRGERRSSTGGRGRLWRWPHSRVPFERPGARTARGSGGRLSICHRLNGSTSQSETSLNLTLRRPSICPASICHRQSVIGRPSISICHQTDRDRQRQIDERAGRLSICHHRLNGQFEGAGTDWADARLGTEGTGLLAGALARRWQLISAGSANKHAGGMRCPSLQPGTPACACWLEPVSLIGALDHAQPRTTAQLRSNAA
jgi:hypothetical protein